MDPMLLASIPDLLLILDRDGSPQEANAAARELLDLGSAESGLRRLHEYLHPEDREALREALEGAFEGWGACLRTVRMTDSRGCTRWLEWHVQLCPSGQALAVGRDVSARVAVELALRESEGRFRALVENTCDWLWEVDVDGRYTYASPQVEALLGYTPAEVVGLTPFHFMPVDEARRVRDIFSALAAARRPFAGLENVNQCKGGRMVVLETSGQPFFDEEGRLRGYRGIDRDVTARKRAEVALRRTSEELEAMFANLHVCIAVLDRDGTILRANTALAESHGTAAEQLVGRSFLALLPCEDDADLLRRVLASGEAYSAVGRVVEHPALGETWWDIMLTPLRGGRGEVEGLVLATINVTDRERHRRAAEAAWQRAQTQLEYRVRCRTEELEAANRELEAFSYSVSHDLRAPLRAINGFSGAMREECGELLDAVCNSYLDRIQASTLRMNELIDGLLMLSRVSRVRITPGETNVSALALEVVQELRAADPEREATVGVEPGLRALGDRTLLRLLLQNLLGNAWKFTATRAQAHIALALEHTAVGPAFVVRDDGVGFDMQYADKLFRPFERLHREEEFEGTGVGLATVKRIVQRHWG